MYVNARNVTNKLDELQAVLLEEHPDILGITKSWTHDDISDAELSYDGYTRFCCDRPCDRRGGGILLYVCNEYHPHDYYPTSKFPEQVWCQLSLTALTSLLIGVTEQHLNRSMHGTLIKN